MRTSLSGVAARLTVGAGLLTSAALLSSCGSGSGSPAATVTRVETRTVTASAAAAPASPSSSEAAGTYSFKLGERFQGGDYTVQAMQYRRDSTPGEIPQPAGGGRWDSVLVKTCVSYPSGTLSQTPWSLRDSSDSKIDASSDLYSQFPSPQYPSGDEPISKGECIRGWITFPVPGKAKITKVRYALASDDDSVPSTIVTWSI